MEKEIKKVISSSEIPVHDLVSWADGLGADDLNEFSNALVSLASQGSPRERFVAFNVISVIDSFNKVNFIKENIQRVDIRRDCDLLPALIWMIQVECLVEYSDFCLNVLKYSKEILDERLYEASFRCLVKMDWGVVFMEILDCVKSCDERRIVDVLAYFRLMHGDDKYAVLLSRFDEDSRRRVMEMDALIVERLNNHYLAIGLK